MDKRWQAFLHELVRTAHGQNLPTALEDKMLADLSIQLLEKIHTLVVALLKNPADRLHYENMVAGNTATQADMKQFLTQRIPDIEQQFEGCLTEFRDDYLRICRKQN